MNDSSFSENFDSEDTVGFSDDESEEIPVRPAEETPPVKAPSHAKKTKKSPSLTWLSDFFKDKKIYLLAFFSPALILLGAYFIFGIHPFGEESVLVLDLNGQYVYYYEHFHQVLRGEGSPFISWSRNFSGETMGIFAYYIASPFMLIVMLLPRSLMTTSILIMQMCKVGAAGVTFCYFLQKQRDINANSALLFSWLYALMSYMTVQLMNPMWLDGLIYLPLIIRGIEILINEKKMLYFIIPLSLMFIAHFYIGWMIAFFSILYFLYYYFSRREEEFKFSHFFMSGIRFAAGGIISAACASWVLIPLYHSLSLGKLEFTDPDFEWETNFKFIDFFRNLLPDMYDTCRNEGSPAIYCGVLTLILVPLYFMNDKIKTRQKMGTAFLALSLVLSMYISNIDIAWHGFQNPNWLPYRYSFTFSFVLLLAAAEAFKNIDGITKKQIAGVFSALVLYVFLVDKQELENAGVITAIWASVIYLAAYAFILTGIKNQGAKHFGLSLACYIMAGAELLITTAYTFTAIDDDVHYSNYEGFNSYIPLGQEVVSAIKAEDSGLYRIESDYHRTVNDAMALGSYGISHSSSTLNAKPIQFLRKLGFSYGGHYIKYRGATYITDAIFGIKYVYERNEIKKGEDGNPEEPEIPESKHYDKLIMTKQNDGNIISVYENPYALPIGYMVNSEAEHCKITGTEYPFENQNRILSSMLSGEYTEFFKKIEIDDIKTENVRSSTYGSHSKYTTITKGENSQVEFTITAPNDQMIYMYFPSKYERRVNLWLNKEFLEYYYESGNMTILPLGRFEEGKELNLITTIANDKDEVLFSDQEFVYLDEELFKSAVGELKKSPLNIEYFSEDHLKGTIEAKEDGIMFTSITNEPGWTVYVDGEETETTELFDALIGVKLKKGAHTIEMIYFPPGLKIGVIISVMGVIICILLGIYEKRRGRKERLSI